MTNKVWIIVLAIVAALASVIDGKAAEPTAVLAKAQKGIETNAKKLVKLASVQSTGHTSTDDVKGVAFKDGSSDSTCRFNWTDEDRKAQSFVTRVEFDANGKLRKLARVQHRLVAAVRHGGLGRGGPRGTDEVIGRRGCDLGRRSNLPNGAG